MSPKDKPFILIARVRVMPGKVEDYLKIAELVDAEVEKTEPGMLYHNFDADPTDPLQFTWTELYKDDESLINHLNNPPVQEYVAKHIELAESLEVEIYGTLDDKTVEYLTVTWEEAGIPFKYFKNTRVGYIRDSIVG
jgi:quinol monooxygenase YgiN